VSADSSAPRRDLRVLIEAPLVRSVGTQLA
jgi:hypothetical protein